MKVIYLDSTKPDLAWYRLYYESIFPAGAEHAARQYMRAITTLTDNPNIGRVVNYNSLRRLSILKTPFAIYYRVVEEHIEIVRLWDQRANPKKLELHEEAAEFT